MFSPAVVRELGKVGRSPLLARLIIEGGVSEALSPEALLAEAFEYAFTSLCRMGNRDDYVYRTAITQKVVLGRHNLRTATVLNEVRAGNSKADVVVLNGTATAYEIKSERDSLQRLATQLADYRSVFASVAVVTSPGHAASVLRIAPQDVGVLVLSSRFRLQVVRDAVDRPERTSVDAMLASLRIDEAISVLARLGIEFPAVPNTQRWAVLSELFAGLDPAQVHATVVPVLKASRSQAGVEPFLRNLPKPLGAAALATGLSSSAYRNVRAASSEPLSAVLAWS